MLLFLIVCFNLLTSGAAVFDTLSDALPFSVEDSNRAQVDRSEKQKSLLSLNWVLTSAPSLDWVSIAPTSTGQYFFAVVRGGGIYSSSDFGTTWTVTSAPSLDWKQIVSSSSGQYLAAVVDGGGIYTSSNFGMAWAQTSAVSANWRGIACDSTGQYLAAAVVNGGIYTSSNYGIAWTITSAPSLAWGYEGGWEGRGIASSHSGQHLVAVSAVGFYTSSDFGATWLKTSNSSAVNIVSSSTGQYWAATDSSDTLSTSSDYGSSWVHRSTYGARGPITSDSTGQYLRSLSFSHQYLYYSNDYGTSWGYMGTSFRGNFISIACSSTCQYMAAAALGTFNTGGILTAQDDSRQSSSTSQPSSQPISLQSQPSAQPSRPSLQPSAQPTDKLSMKPTVSPTEALTTTKPTANPTPRVESTPMRPKVPPFTELYDRANIPATKSRQSSVGSSKSASNAQAGDEIKQGKIKKMREKVAVMRGEL